MSNKAMSIDMAEISLTRNIERQLYFWIRIRKDSRTELLYFTYERILHALKPIASREKNLETAKELLTNIIKDLYLNTKEADKSKADNVTQSIINSVHNGLDLAQIIFLFFAQSVVTKGTTSFALNNLNKEILFNTFAEGKLAHNDEACKAFNAIKALSSGRIFKIICSSIFIHELYDHEISYGYVDKSGQGYYNFAKNRHDPWTYKKVNLESNFDTDIHRVQMNFLNNFQLTQLFLRYDAKSLVAPLVSCIQDNFNVNTNDISDAVSNIATGWIKHYDQLRHSTAGKEKYQDLKYTRNDEDPKDKFLSDESKNFHTIITEYMNLMNILSKLNEAFSLGNFNKTLGSFKVTKAMEYLEYTQHKESPMKLNQYDNQYDRYNKNDSQIPEWMHLMREFELNKIKIVLDKINAMKLYIDKIFRINFTVNFHALTLAIWHEIEHYKVKQIEDFIKQHNDMDNQTGFDMMTTINHYIKLYNNPYNIQHPQRPQQQQPQDSA